MVSVIVASRYLQGNQTMIGNVFNSAVARCFAVCLLALGFADADAQTQGTAIGQKTRSDTVLVASSPTRTVDVPVGTPPRTPIQWTVFSFNFAPLNLGTTFTNGNLQADSPSFTIGTQSSAMITACLPSATSTSDPAACAFFRYIGCANLYTLNGGSGIAGQPVQPSPSIRFSNEVTVNGVADIEPRGEVVVAWSLPNPTGGGIIGSTGTIADKSGFASVAYTAGTNTPTQTIRATLSSNYQCVSGRPGFTNPVDIPVSVSPAQSVNVPPSATIVTPASARTINAGGSVSLRALASDVDRGDSVATLSFLARNLRTDVETELARFTSPTTAPNIYDYVWSGIAEGSYRVSALATDTRGASTRSVSVQIDAIRVASEVKVETPSSALEFKSGVPFKIALIATDANGGVPNQTIEWDLVKAAASAASQKAATANTQKDTVKCPAEDVLPAQRTVLTGADGRAEVSFTPGCAAQDRIFSFGLQGAAKSSVTLRGPISQVDRIEIPVQLVAKSIVANPGQPISISVTAINKAGAPVAQVPLAWKLIPANAGSVEPSAAATDTNGAADAKVTLATSAIQATLEVCVVGQKTSCPSFALKNAQEFVAKPAAAATAAANTHALGGTRLQISQLTTRFQQQRNEIAGGFSNGAGVTIDGARVPTPSSGSADADGVKRSKWGVFTLGDIDVSRSNDAAGGRTKLTTKGLTVGVDYRALPSVTVGAAIGGLRGDASLPDAASQKAKGSSGALFGQWFAPGQFYANAVANYGRNSYDLKRFALDSAAIESSTKSKQTGFQLEGGYNFSRDRFSVSPYLRYEFVRVALGAINESGHPDAISVSASSLRANTFAFGVVGDARFNTTSGVWIPGVRVEYLNEKQRQSIAIAQLIGGTPLPVPVPIAPYDSSYGNVGLSLQWLTGVAGQPISVFLGFDGSFGKSGTSVRRYTAGVKVPL
jgi:outer membrane autotransporter protein